MTYGLSPTRPRRERFSRPTDLATLLPNAQGSGRSTQWATKSIDSLHAAIAWDATSDRGTLCPAGTFSSTTLIRDSSTLAGGNANISWSLSIGNNHGTEINLSFAAATSSKTKLPERQGGIGNVSWSFEITRTTNCPPSTIPNATVQTQTNYSQTSRQFDADAKANAKTNASKCI